MYNFSIGILLDSLRLPFAEAVEKAAAAGAAGVQMYLTRGQVHPSEITEKTVKERLDIINSHGLTVSAICGDLGGGFGNTEENPRKIELSKRILEMTMLFGTNIVTTHIGVVPEDKNDPKYSIMQEACGQLAEYADSLGGHFAVETGPESAITLKGFLDSLNSRGVAVNLDPANLVMVAGDDPVKAVYTLKDYIVHTHAKDGVKLTDPDAGKLCGEEHLKELLDAGKTYKEFPLGSGKVDFDRYLAALNEIGYNGYLTIEREGGDDRVGDVARAVKFLESKIGKK
ncbi:MAG: sugar phosphate isomerase/epimerase [Clostridia bacterium]|nr:sugar phosphate isomerase/epimerase [Clostridia bacterium]